MKHLGTPYEQFACDDNDKQYSEADTRAKSLMEIDCPDCIKFIWDVLEEAMV